MKIQQLSGSQIDDYIIESAVSFSLGKQTLGYQHNAQDAKRNIVWGAIENNQVLAGLMQYDLHCYIDQKRIKLLGIGGVITKPEARLQGIARTLLVSVLCSGRENGFLLSGLIPFNHEFYRKLGYELCYAQQIYTFDLGKIGDVPAPYNVKRLADQPSLEEMLALYRVFIQKQNLAIERTTDSWPGFERILEGTAADNCVYKYGIYDNSEKMEAYVVFAYQEKPEGKTMCIREAAWISPDAFWRLLGFLKTFYPHYLSASIPLPEDVRIDMLLPDAYSCKVFRKYRYMVRILNVKKTLECVNAPEGHGQLLMKVHDVILPENAGVYKLTWDGGMVTAEHTSENADLEMNITTLAQLVTGHLNFQEALYRQDLAVHKPCEDAIRFFSGRSLFKNDDF